MGHFDDISSALADEDYDQLTRPQAEALIEALVLATVSEGEVPQKEESELQKSVAEIDRRATFSADDYLATARQEARQLVDDPTAIRQRADDIAGRLHDETLRDEAYYLAARISAIDAEVVADETDILTTFVDAFEIPRERLKLLTRRLRHQV